MKFVTLRQFNNVLSLAVVGLCLYILAAPLWPQVTYRTQSSPPLVQAVERGDPKPPPPADNTLVIPRLKLQEVIHSGGEWQLSKGIWHPDNTSTPDRSGNTILSGHRFTYGGPAVLYHLDKVQVGDGITVFWDKQQYDYQVTSVQTVPPSATNVLAPTTESQLTIYTCTPLVTAKNRLVVIAKPVEASP
jgi:LPXTG-site transpeptidase (sortase) family protein